ncbi:MAG: YjjG family noncanonical pyrimidine nucleotidase [Prevotellaceae bacterium]|jgi:putative hydrolase of the HAD superfamily|nr:YjjG family noncanonical pyrimidine nucleotidase [Prevotellaceae bacterium]
MWLENKYRCIFFDLDRTLWDFESNATETLHELYVKYNLHRLTDDPQKFIDTYSANNRRLWAEYTAGNLKKDRLRQLRFYLTLKQLGFDNRDLGKQMDIDYITICPQKTMLFPHTKEILDYLSAKKYKLYIVTNGFSEVQSLKLKNSGINGYFEAVFTSEEAGYQKPDTRIFQYALSKAKVSPKNCMMIGDDWESDICGAKNAGIPHIFFNPHKLAHEGKPTYEIASLDEIKQILY